MKNEMRASVLLNSAQFGNTLILSAFVPAMIGLSNYGTFAAIYALPGALQSSMEVYLLTSQKKPTSEYPFRQHVTFLSITLAPTFGFYLACYSLPIALCSVILLVALSARTLFSTRVIHLPINALVRYYILNELIVAGAYFAVIGSALKFGVLNHYLPLSMLILSNLISIVYFYVSGISALVAESASGNEKNSNNSRGWLGKIYEEIYLTLPPLALSIYVSPGFAGQFRVAVSIFKAASKVFPLRFEIIQQSIDRGTFKWSTFKRLCLLAGASGLVVFILLYFGLSAVLRNAGLADSFHPLLLSIGPVVISLVCFPIFIARSTVKALTPFFTTAILLWGSILLASGQYFAWTFVISSASLSVWIVFWFKSFTESIRVAENLYI
jgi:hypothetical protein